MSNSDRRYLKSEEAILSSFYNLILHDEVVTVSSIAREANIDRKTFYLHYSNISELMDSFRVNMFSDLTKYFAAEDITDPMNDQFIDDLFIILNRNLELFSKISSNPDYESMWFRSTGASGELYEHVRDSISDMEKTVFRLYINSFTHAIVTVCNAWMSGRYGIDEDAAKQMCYKIARDYLLIMEGN